MAYPLVSLSYVFGMIAAMVFFNEPVNLTKWIGVLLIMLGCYFIAK
jgi:undecaprenyl phosphate-alpha-L-ara4N flippase subunit ArnE